MALPNLNFSTGPSSLPDAGKLSYNGCVFSPLFETKLSGKVVPDNANRITKMMEYTLVADGYVTLPDGATDINSTMRVLRDLLTVHGGALNYTGRGFDLVVNDGEDQNQINVGKVAFGARVTDVAWGPVPELIEFQPLGQGRSAKVQWKVTTRITEVPGTSIGASAGLLQLNYETVVKYSEDGYSSLSIVGTLEVPLTRTPKQSPRSPPYTADDFRKLLETRILGGIDLSRFRMIDRSFNVSRDKRTLDWNVSAEEKPYMDQFVDCTLSRGSYDVSPAKAGPGLSVWLCSLNATYTVRRGAPRRTAWLAFLALVRLRMSKSGIFDPPKIDEAPKPPAPFRALGRQLQFVPGSLNNSVGIFGQIIAQTGNTINSNTKVLLINFSIREGLYLDSKTISFSAAWRLIASFQHILINSGIWTKLPEVDANGKNLWAASMKNISGAQSWLINKVNPSLDVIVDFGSGV